MTDKIYIQAQDLLEDSFRLADAVKSDGFEPTFIVALWRGGAPIGLAIQEFFAYHGVETDHILVRTQSYSGIENQSDQVVIYGINYLIKNLSSEDKVLIVDDVFDTGKTIDAIVEDMKKRLKLNMPQDVRVAVPYFKPKRNKTERLPDYYLHVTDDWLIYPHSIEGLTPQELEANKPEIYGTIKAYL